MWIGPPTRWRRAIQPSRFSYVQMSTFGPLIHCKFMGSLEWISTACSICFGEMNEHEWTPLSFLVEPVYFFTPFRRNNGKSFFKWLRFNCAEKFGKEFGAGLVGCSFHRSGWFLEPHFFPEFPGVYFLSRTIIVSQLFAFMFCCNRCFFCSELNFDRFEMAMMVHTYWVSKEKVDQEKISSLPTTGNMNLSWCPVSTFRWNNSWRMETCRHRWMTRDGRWLVDGFAHCEFYCCFPSD